MTHPLTPREKVQPFERYPALASWIAKMASVGSGLSLGEWMTFVGSLNAAIVQAEQRTALASGSGDHAELARLAEMACAPMSTKTIGMHLDAMAKFKLAANPAAVLALLAENAALRGNLTKTERDYTELRDSYDAIVNKLGIERTHGSRETKRATEAERKLAEAVEWRPIETAPGPDHAMFVVRAFEVTTFSGVIYTSDPVCVWRNIDGSFARWKQEFQPTHWLPLPPAPGAEA